jgi:phage terminase large subunit
MKRFLEKAETYKLEAEKQELKEKGAKYKTHYYYNYIGGWKERADGTVFNYVVGPFNDKLPLRCLHLDWGYNPDPLAVGEIAIDSRSKKIYVREKIYSTMINDVPTALLNAGINKRDLIICDTSEPRTKTNVQSKGFNIQNAVKNLIKDDIREISQYDIILDPDSSNYKIELDNYVWNDKKASIPIDKYNHLLDGMRYGFNRLTKKVSFSEAVGSPQLF